MKLVSMKLSGFFWIMTWVTMVFGFAISIFGAYLEMSGAPSGVGLYMIIVGPLIAGLSGIWAQLAAKYQAEEQARAFAPSAPAGSGDKARAVLELLDADKGLSSIKELEDRALAQGISREEFRRILIALLREGVNASDGEAFGEGSKSRSRTPRR